MSTVVLFSRVYDGFIISFKSLHVTMLDIFHYNNLTAYFKNEHDTWPTHLPRPGLYIIENDDEKYEIRQLVYNDVHMYLYNVSILTFESDIRN